MTQQERALLDAARLHFTGLDEEDFDGKAQAGMDLLVEAKRSIADKDVSMSTDEAVNQSRVARHVKKPKRG